MTRRVLRAPEIGDRLVDGNSPLYRAAIDRLLHRTREPLESVQILVVNEVVEP